MLFNGRLIISPQLEVLTVPGQRSATVWPLFRLSSTCLSINTLSTPSLTSSMGIRYTVCLSILVPRPTILCHVSNYFSLSFLSATYEVRGAGCGVQGAGCGVHSHNFRNFRNSACLCFCMNLCDVFRASLPPT